MQKVVLLVLLIPAAAHGSPLDEGSPPRIVQVDLRQRGMATELLSGIFWGEAFLSFKSQDAKVAVAHIGGSFWFCFWGEARCTKIGPIISLETQRRIAAFLTIAAQERICGKIIVHGDVLEILLVGQQLVKEDLISEQEGRFGKWHLVELPRGDSCPDH